MASTCSAVMEVPKHLVNLDPKSRARYCDKVSVVNGTDPYLLPANQWSKNQDDLPRIDFPDVYTYLVLKTSAYTNEEFKAYKGRKAYNQFTSGWIQETLSHKPPDCENVIVKAMVLHSQRVSEFPLQPWFIIDPNGTVLCAHCTCMAGLGETCTHVGALLFLLEANRRLAETKTVTGLPAYWMIPSACKKVEPLPLSKIDFSSAKAKKAKLDSQILNNAQTTPTHHATATSNENNAHKGILDVNILLTGQLPTCNFYNTTRISGQSSHKKTNSQITASFL